MRQSWMLEFKLSFVYSSQSYGADFSKLLSFVFSLAGYRHVLVW